MITETGETDVFQKFSGNVYGTGRPNKLTEPWVNLIMCVKGSVFIFPNN